MQPSTSVSGLESRVVGFFQQIGQIDTQDFFSDRVIDPTFLDQRYQQRSGLFMARRPRSRHAAE